LVHKARENAEAANLLFAWQYFDAAANRFYYALYQAGWAFLVKLKHPVPRQAHGSYFPHSFDRTLDQEGFGACLRLQPDWRVLWDEMRNHRVKADYHRDGVRGEDLEGDLMEFAEGVVSAVQAFV